MAGRLRLDFKANVPPEVMVEVGRSIKRQVEEKNQQLVIQISPDLPKVWADRTHVLQVLTNLVSNSYKYTPAGGQMLVTVEASENRWDAVGSRRVVHLWVQDNGIGVTEEDQKKIF